MSAGIDQNGRQTMIALSGADGSSIVRVTADPSTHAMSSSDAATGSDHGNNGGSAAIDSNSRSGLFALSSTGAIVNLYADASGKLLIQST